MAIINEFVTEPHEESEMPNSIEVFYTILEGENAVYFNTLNKLSFVCKNLYVFRGSSPINCTAKEELTSLIENEENNLKSLKKLDPNKNYTDLPLFFYFWI